MTVLALDVGGSNVRGALISADGEILARRTEATTNRDPGLRMTRTVAERLATDAERMGDDVDAVGAGFPEYVDRSGMLTSREVLDWETQPRELLADLAPAVAVDSDVRCGALAELKVADAAERDFVYVTLGTGIAHALVCDGAVRRGVRGEAIALGEIPVAPGIDPGWTGSLESFASGKGIGHRYVERTGRTVTDGARSVVELADRGDDAAVEVLVSAGQATGHALAELAWLLDPAVIILGGGLGVASGRLRDAMLARYNSVTRSRPGAPPVRTSMWRENAGLVGAGHLAWSVTTRQEGEGGR